MKWLSDHIQMPEGWEFYNASAETGLIDTALADSMIILKGTTDVAIADIDYVKLFDTARGIRVAIELEKQVQKKDCMQAILKLIAANCHSNYSIMTLLTNLRQTWHCYWINRDGIQECWFEPPHGIAFVESHLRGERKTIGCLYNARLF